MPMRCQFVLVQEIQQRDVQVVQQDIRHLRRQHARTLEHVVQMRLRDPGMTGEASFGQFAAVHAPLNVGDQPQLQELKIHGVWRGRFPLEIGVS